MNKTQKKCLMASVGMHALLIAILAVAPAFLKKDIEVNEPPIDFISPKVVMDAMNRGGGGAPVAPKTLEKKVEPPVPRPPVKIPQPAPPPPPRQKPVVKKDPPKPPPLAPPKKTEPVKKPDPPKRTPVKTKPQPKPQRKPPPKIKVDLTNITSLKKDDSAAKKRAAREQERQRAAANERAKAAVRYAELKKQNKKAWDHSKPNVNLDAASKSAARISNGLQGSTAISASGVGRAAFTDYKRVVATIYDGAWRENEIRGAPGSRIKVRITIERSGKVLKEEIIEGSKNSVLGRTVQLALQRVDRIRAFPSGVKDPTKSFVIVFTVDAKL
jgi:outer membrane biosynthesis protein TonB